jgi:hypothetical protein
MSMNVKHGTNRRTFLQACAAAVAATGSTAGMRAQASSSGPVLRLEADPQRCLIPVLSWDTEGGDRVRSNLLRSPGLGLRVWVDNQWFDGTEFPATVQPAANGTRYLLQLDERNTLEWNISSSRDGFEMTLSAQRPAKVEVVFPFNLRVTPTTVLPAVWHADGHVETPLVISAPDFGQMLLRVAPGGAIKGRLEGFRRPFHMANLILELPPLNENHKYTFSFTPVTLAAPAGLGDSSIWQLARRGWFNAFQPASAWGDRSTSYSAEPGILANNVVSDPVSFCLYSFADHMLWTPWLAEGISAAQLVRNSIEYWLLKRSNSSGEIVGYGDYYNFLDANPSPIIAAWDYVEASGDLTWLERMIWHLENAANYCAYRDMDRDGMVEATQSGNANTFLLPARSSNWFDAMNYGHKDGFSNALIYRAWRCLADLEAKLHREERRAHYTQLAERLRTAYVAALYNPATGWFANWRSADGALHDYACPVVNGMAIEYGLVGPSRGREILGRLWSKIESVGFTRFDLGIPSTLVPVLRSDYMPGGFGCPTREDGTDTFQHYQNGGITAGRMQHFLAACYVTGLDDRAERVLKAMLGRQQGGGFQNGVRDELPEGMEWTTWSGETCGYEGYLSDNYSFLLSVLLREPAFRRRFYRPLATA